MSSSISSSSNSPSPPYDYDPVEPSQLAPFLNHTIEISGKQIKVQDLIEKILSKLDTAKQSNPSLENCEVCFAGRYVTRLLVKDCETSDIDIKLIISKTKESPELSQISCQLEEIVESALKELLALPNPYRQTFSSRDLCPSPIIINNKLGVENYVLPSNSQELPVEISLNTLANANVPTHALNSDSFYINFALFNGKLGSKGASPNVYRMYSLDGDCAQVKEDVKAGIIKTTVIASEAFEQIWFRIIKDITLDGGSSLTTETNEQFFAKEAQAGELILKNINSFINKKIKKPLFYLLNALFLWPPESEFLNLFWGHLQKSIKESLIKPGLEWIAPLQNLLLEEKNPKVAIALLKGLIPHLAKNVILKNESHYQCTFEVDKEKYYILIPIPTDEEKEIIKSKGILSFPKLTLSNLAETLKATTPEGFLYELQHSLPLIPTQEKKTKLFCDSLKQIFLEHQDKMDQLSPAFWNQLTTILSLKTSKIQDKEPWKDLLMTLLFSIPNTPSEEMKTCVTALFSKVHALSPILEEKDKFLYALYAQALLGMPLSLPDFLNLDITDSHIEDIKKFCTLWKIEDPFNFNKNFQELLKQDPAKALKLLEVELAIKKDIFSILPLAQEQFFKGISSQEREPLYQKFLENILEKEENPEKKIQIALIAYQVFKEAPKIALFLEKNYFTKEAVEKIININNSLKGSYEKILSDRIEQSISEKKPILACNLLKSLPPGSPSITSHLTNLLKSCSNEPKKAIDAIQEHFSSHWIDILKEIKEPTLRYTLLMALSKMSLTEPLQTECFNAFKEGLPQFPALIEESPERFLSLLEVQLSTGGDLLSILPLAQEQFFTHVTTEKGKALYQSFLERILDKEKNLEKKIQIALIAYQTFKEAPGTALFLEKTYFAQNNVEEILSIAEHLKVPYEKILSKRIDQCTSEKKPILACNLLKSLPANDPSITPHLIKLFKICSNEPKKAIDAIQTHFENRFIDILNGIKEPALKYTLIAALSEMSPTEALQKECFHTLKNGLADYLALKKEDPLKILRPFLKAASDTDKFDLAQKCVLLPETVDKNIKQSLFNQLMADSSLESHFQKTPQTLDGLNKWMDFLIQGNLLPEKTAAQILRKIKEDNKAPIDKLSLINRLSPFLSEENKVSCFEEIALEMQTAIDRKDPIEQILPFTTFILQNPPSSFSTERYKEIRSICLAFLVDNLEKVAPLATSNPDINILLEQAKTHLSPPYLDLRAAFINKCLTLPPHLRHPSITALLKDVMTHAENCDFLKESIEIWNNKKIETGLILLQEDPEHMKKFSAFAAENVTDFSLDIIKKMNPYLTDSSRKALFEKGLEEFHKNLETPKALENEKALLLLLRSAPNKENLSLLALEKLSYYPAGIIKQIALDSNEKFLPIFIRKSIEEASAIKKLKDPIPEERIKNYLYYLTEIKKPPLLLENPDLYISFVKVAYLYISPLSAIKPKDARLIAAIESAIKKAPDLSKSSEKNQSIALLTSFSCPSNLTDLDHSKLFNLVKSCPSSIIPEISKEILKWPSEYRALWIQALSSRLETSTDDKTFLSVEEHLSHMDGKGLKILDAPSKTPPHESTFMKLSLQMITQRELSSKAVSECTKALRSIFLKNPNFKNSKELAFSLLRDVHFFRMKELYQRQNIAKEMASSSTTPPPTPLQIQTDYIEYIEFVENLEVSKGGLIQHLKKQKILLEEGDLYPLLQLYDKPISLFDKKHIRSHLYFLLAVRDPKNHPLSGESLGGPKVYCQILYLLCLTSKSEKISEQDEIAFYDFVKERIPTPLSMSFLLHTILEDSAMTQFRNTLYISILPPILRMCVKELDSLSAKTIRQAIATDEGTRITYGSAAFLLGSYLNHSTEFSSTEIKNYLLTLLPHLIAPLKDLQLFFSDLEKSVLKEPGSNPLKETTKQLDYALFFIDLKHAMQVEISTGGADPGITNYLENKTLEYLTPVLHYLENNPKPELVLKLKEILQAANLRKGEITGVLQNISTILNKI